MCSTSGSFRHPSISHTTVGAETARLADPLLLAWKIAPAIAMGNLYQATAQALSNAAHNATAAQQDANAILQATTTQGVSILYGIDTASTGIGTREILENE